MSADGAARAASARNVTASGSRRGSVSRPLSCWAEGIIAKTAFSRYSITGGGLTCGWEQGPAVGEDYEAPFPFAGTLHQVEISVNGDAWRDPEAEFEAIMSEQ